MHGTSQGFSVRVMITLQRSSSARKVDKMADWFFNLSVPWMALVIFLSTYLIAFSIDLVVTRLAVDERAKGFKAVSPGMLPPLGILFALLVGFIAVEVWGNFDKAKLAWAREMAPI